uniref:Phosducin domain-containing protein n=1 Tax=Strigamia maritima TaxID=126957 RepID=T1INB7_STRMM
MQNPNEDTQWNDILREKGIIPNKDTEKTFTENEIVQIAEDAIKDAQIGKKLEDLNLDELDELEDEEDEKVILEYRMKRIREMTDFSKRANYGDVREISAVDYVDEVNKAGDGVWVVLHLYKQGVPLCKLINQFLEQLAMQHPATKFLKSISTTCVPNYSDKNLPTIFIYFEGNMKKQFIGPFAFGGMKLTRDVLEWMLAEAGTLKTELERDPRPAIKDVLMSSLKARGDEESDDDD